MLQYLLTQISARRDDEGATAVEYGLMVALIAAVIIAVVTTLGTDLMGQFNLIEDGVSTGSATNDPAK